MAIRETIPQPGARGLTTFKESTRQEICEIMEAARFTPNALYGTEFKEQIRDSDHWLYVTIDSANRIVPTHVDDVPFIYAAPNFHFYFEHVLLRIADAAADYYKNKE